MNGPTFEPTDEDIEQYEDDLAWRVANDTANDPE